MGLLNTVEILAIGRRCVAMDFAISLTISVIGGVISYYICKWLDENFFE
jgi:hypothetical protein